MRMPVPSRAKPLESSGGAAANGAPCGLGRNAAARLPLTSAGEILQQEYLVPLEMSQKHLADHIGQDVKVINRIVNGRSAVTAEVALKLAATFRTPSFG